MKIRRQGNIVFNAFRDGICDIYNENDSEEKEYKYQGICFDNKTLGYKRAYAAQAVQSNINRVIRIPQVEGLENHDILEIDSICYDIDLIQIIDNSNPPAIDLTLKKIGARI